MIWVSFAANLIVLVPVLLALYRGSPAMEAALGPDTPARRVTASVYLAIACASASVFAFPDKAAEVAHTLFPLQILYKLISLPLLGLHSPVARANAAVALLHFVTMLTLYGVI